MKARLTLLRLTAGAFLCLVAPAAAHHSASMYARDAAIEVRGVVKAFHWVNPHASIVFVEQGGAGRTWVVETTSPGVLTRNGWSKRSIKPGDRVLVKVAPLRAGGPAGAVLGLTNLETGVSLPGPI